MSYGPTSVLFAILRDKVTSIDEQLIASSSASDPSWPKRAAQARQIFARKQRTCRERLDAIRNSSLEALGGLDGVSSCRLSMIKALLGVIGRHVDMSKLTVEERASVDASQQAAYAPTPKLGKFAYSHELNAVLGDDGAEVAALSRHGWDREELGLMLAAAPTLLAHVERLIPAAQATDPEAAAAASALVRQLR